MFKSFKLTALRSDPRIGFYFRYPLYHSEFREVRDPKDQHLIGRFAAKPLYGRLTATGKVDRSEGLNGQIAVVFIPARARSVLSAKLYLTRVKAQKITLSNGKRNWQVIRAAAVRTILRHAEKKV